MSWNTRRALLVLTGLGLLASLAVWQVDAQVAVPVKGGGIRQVGPGKTPSGEVDPYEAGPGLSLVTDSNLRKKMEAANDYIRDEQWDKACHLLQGLIESKHDAFVVVPTKGEAKTNAAPWISVRAEANRKLGALPAGGLKFYQEEYGTQASDLLKEAVENGDGEKLARVAQWYLHTEAGATAAGLLGTRKLDRGDYMAAALYFDLLLTREGNDKLSEDTLIRAALSFHLAKEPEKEEIVWKKLAVRGDSVDLGGEKVALDDLRKEFDQYTRATLPVALVGSPLYRGNAARNAQGLGGRAFLEHSWVQEMSRESQTMDWVKPSMNQQLSKGLPVLPTFFPVAVTVETGTDTIPELLFRSYYGVQAVDVRTGKLKWDSDSRWTLDKMARDHKKMPYLQQWITQWQSMARPNLLWENSVIGTLSTDGRLVYLIEDLQVPPFQNQNPYGGMQPQPSGGDPFITEAIQHSELNAYDLRTGKIQWHVGGAGEKKDDPANELRESYFLGAPLPLGGKLYILCEKNQELRLVCLDPAKNPDKENPVVWAQPLASTRDNKLAYDVGRRIQAAHLAYGEGILVCPTNAGAVLGVDLLTHSLVWARPYRDKEQGVDPNNGMMKGAFPPGAVPPPGFNPGMTTQGIPTPTDWKTSAPVIVDGKVVFTAPDGQKIYCLNLRDGTPLWTANRTDDDLYLAGVFGGKVVIVTKKSVRSLNLADGQAGWREIETGFPSGQGVASDNIYYLPLRSAALSKKPEILALDAEHGTIVAHTPSRSQEIPGNLLFFDGMVISQSTTEVAAYPQLKIKLDQVDKSIAKLPNDPANRCERGELRLSEGDLRGAIEDLRVALDTANKPPAEVVSKSRRKLHEALAELAQSAIQKKDFASVEPFLKTFEDVCKVDETDVKEEAARTAEESRRLGIYLCLLGKGREQQGRLVEAFEAYSRYGALSHGELMTSLDEPSVKANTQVWARGRINAMMAAAPADQRKPLEELIESRWQQLKSNPELPAMTAFVGMFGTQFRAGREARLELATQLMDQEGKEQLLTAEGLLLQVSRQQQDRPQAARATEALARLLIRKNYLEDAAYYYSVLGRDFGDVMVRDGKTGSDLWNELATDKRLLPYLGGNGQGWGTGKLKAANPKNLETGNFMRPGRFFTFEVEGDPLPFFQRHRLALNIDFHEFRMTDRATSDEWKKNLDRGGSNNQFNVLIVNNNQSVSARFPARTLGHLIVLQLGHMAYGIDPINREVRWTKNLFGSSGFAAGSNLVVDPRDGGVELISTDGFRQRLGGSGPVEPGCLCLQTLDGLLAIDPVSGELLWTRSDVRGNCVVFGDAETLFVVELNKDNRAATGRAIRAQDGVTLDLPADFVNAYQNQIHTLGHQLVVKDTTANGVTLRLYDILAGKDVWKREFPANTQVFRTEDGDLCGAVDPAGKVTVLDAQNAKDLLKASVDPKHVEKALALNLLQDGEFFYLGVQQPNDPAVNPFGGPYMNVLPDSGVRQLPINGWFYAFSKSTGKMKWRAETKELMLLMEEYKDVPVLVFTSRYQKVLGPGGRFGSQQSVAVKVLDKHTGKLVFDAPDIANGAQFHTYTIDRRAGKIELISPNSRLTLTREASPMSGEKSSKLSPQQIQVRQRSLEEAQRARNP